jgi:uncharacterized protein HemX
MNPTNILRALAALLVVAALAAGGFAAWKYTAMAQRVTELEESAKELADLKQTVETLNREAVRRSAFDAALRNARATTNRSVEIAANADPETGDYLSRRIPDELRRAHLESRAGAVTPADRH